MTLPPDLLALRDKISRGEWLLCRVEDVLYTDDHAQDILSTDFDGFNNPENQQARSNLEYVQALVNWSHTL